MLDHHSTRAQKLPPLCARSLSPTCRPPEKGTNVYVTTILDRLLKVNDLDYRFQAMLYMQLSWRDARARPARDNATQAALDPAYNNGGGEERQAGYAAPPSTQHFPAPFGGRAVASAALCCPLAKSEPPTGLAVCSGCRPECRLG